MGTQSPEVTAEAGLAAGSTTEALRQQLFCYAQDLQDLITQYSHLQDNYQLSLQAMQSGHQDDDLLLNALLQPGGTFFVTTQHGDILFTSPTAARIMGSTGQPASLLQWLEPAHAYSALLLLNEMTGRHGDRVMELRQLELVGACPGEPGRRFDALIMQVHKHGGMQVYWLLQDSAPGPDRSLVDQTCAFINQGDVPLFVTDPGGKLCAVNEAFTRVTGHSRASAVGQDERMIRARQHPTGPNGELRQTLVKKGNWSGNVLHQHRDGHVYIAAMTYKLIRGPNGQPVSYMAAFTDLSAPDHPLAQPTHLAFHDAVTDLPNHSLFENRLALAMADVSSKSAGLYVLLVDLAGARDIALEAGADVTNQLLRVAAGRLHSAVRRADMVARLSEHVLAVLLPGVSTQVDAISVANAILVPLNRAAQVGPNRWMLNAQLGGAAFPQDATDVAGLLRHARLALQAARQQKIGVCFYQPGMTCPHLP